MKKDISFTLIDWIKKLHHTCIKLNNRLIMHYELDKNEVLSNREHFELPIVAVIHKIIPRQGAFKYGNEQIVNYHFHGTGVTFFIEKVKIFFEYYPKTSPERKPILGLTKVFDFICSSNPNDDLCNLQEIQNNLMLLFQDKTLTRVDENYFEFHLNGLS